MASYLLGYFYHDPLAFFSGLIAIGTALCSLSGWIVWKYRRSSHQFEVLYHDSNKALEECRLERALAQEERAQLESRMPIFALESAAKPPAGIDPNIYAHKMLQQWLEQEAKPVSEILFQLSQWAFFSAAGDEWRAAGLSVAKSYANAANAVCPNNNDVKSWAQELAAWRRIEGQPNLELNKALSILESADKFGASFDPEAVEDGLAAIQEAWNLQDQGLYQLAQKRSERALWLLTHELGSEAQQTLRARFLNAQLLNLRGLYAEGFSEAWAAADLQEKNSELGPDHWQTLQTRNAQAYALQRLNRLAEALAVIETACAKRPLDTADDRVTLMLHGRHAAILENQGRLSEAHALALLVAQKYDAILGRADLGTLDSWHLCVRMLTAQKRFDEAHAVIDDVIRREPENPILNELHPITIAIRSLLGYLLLLERKFEQSRDVLMKVVERQSAAFGDGHLFVLHSQYNLGLAFDGLGQSQEALGIFEDVLAKAEQNNRLGKGYFATEAVCERIGEIQRELRGVEAIQEGPTIAMSATSNYEWSVDRTPWSVSARNDGFRR